MKKKSKIHQENKHLFDSTNSQRNFIIGMPIITILLGCLITNLLNIDDNWIADGVIFGLAFGLLIDYIFVKIKKYGQTTSFWLFISLLIFIALCALRIKFKSWEVSFMICGVGLFFIMFGLLASYLKRGGR